MERHRIWWNIFDQSIHLLSMIFSHKEHQWLSNIKVWELMTRQRAHQRLWMTVWKNVLARLQQKRLNELLLKMTVKDFQTCSIVTDTREFVAALDPSYCIPSRTAITTVLLLAAYNNGVDWVKAVLADAEALTLTTDSWTSLMTESYISVTCHFITSDFRLDSCLLQCNKFTERHTAENLVRDLLAVVCEWSVDNKPQAVVTDSTANIAQ